MLATSLRLFALIIVSLFFTSRTQAHARTIRGVRAGEEGSIKRKHRKIHRGRHDVALDTRPRALKSKEKKGSTKESKGQDDEEENELVGQDDEEDNELAGQDVQGDDGKAVTPIESGQNAAESSHGGSSNTGMVVTAAGTGIAVLALILLHVYWKKSKSNESNTEKNESSKTALDIEDIDITLCEGTKQPFDLTGTYRLSESQNFDAFLEAQGVSWVVRTATCRARPIKNIEQNGSFITVKIKGIPRFTCIVNGPPVRYILRDRVFETTACCSDDNTLQVLNRAVGDDHASSRLRFRPSDDKSRITLELTTLFEDERELVESILTFERISEDNGP